MSNSGFTHENTVKSIEWYTPPWIFDRLGLQFDLDPCSPPNGIPWIPSKQFYSKENDGLSQPWNGRVWLNPPYGKETPAWLAKMHQHRVDGGSGIALLFSRTDCQWFHNFAVKADAILFLKGRVKFVDGAGATGGSGAGSGSMLVAWGNDEVLALQSMRDLGHLVNNHYMRVYEV